MILTQIPMAGKDPKAAPKTRWADSIKHDLHSAGLNNTDAAQMVFDRPQWKAIVICLRTADAGTRARLLSQVSQVLNGAR